MHDHAISEFEVTDRTLEELSHGIVEYINRHQNMQLSNHKISNIITRFLMVSRHPSKT